MTEKSIKTILLIEDNPGDARLIREMFKEQGSQSIDLTVVECMKDAEKHLAKHSVDIILLDLMIPNITGIEILRKLRDPASPPIKAKIIITTNLEQREDVRADIERQADGYLVKAELTPRELVEFLNTVK